MLSKRIRERVPSARFICTAKLCHHQLRLHKIGADNSAKADCFETESTDDYIFGVVFNIDADEKSRLDAAEGLGYGYDEKIVKLEIHGKTPKQRHVDAFTYFATHINPDLLPTLEYKNYVLSGAKEHNLPPGYVQAIVDVKAAPRV